MEGAVARTGVFSVVRQSTGHDAQAIAGARAELERAISLAAHDGRQYEVRRFVVCPTRREDGTEWQVEALVALREAAACEVGEITTNAPVASTRTRRTPAPKRRARSYDEPFRHFPATVQRQFEARTIVARGERVQVWERVR